MPKLIKVWRVYLHKGHDVHGVAFSSEFGRDFPTREEAIKVKEAFSVAFPRNNYFIRECRVLPEGTGN